VNWLQKICQGYYGQMKGYWHAFWIAPDGKVFDVQDTHQTWPGDNAELLDEEYNIDLQSWEIDRMMESEQEEYDSMLQQLIREKAFDLDIPEDQVEITEEEKEQLQTYAAEADHYGNYGVDIVDLLIRNGWIRVAEKTHIHFEGPEDFKRIETFLLDKYPHVWSHENREIIVNNRVTSGRDLRDMGSLKKALEHSNMVNNYYMMNR